MLQELAKLISATILFANMKGKIRISQKKSIIELLGEEALVEVVLRMKTIDELELKVKDMEARLTIMENIKTDMTTAVATLKKDVDTTGMGARHHRADRVKKSAHSGPLQYGIQMETEMM